MLQAGWRADIWKGQKRLSDTNEGGFGKNRGIGRRREAF